MDTAERQRLERELELEDLRAVLATAEGARVLLRILSWSRPLGAVSPADVGAMSWTEGQRNVGLRLLAEAREASPVCAAEMLKTLYLTGA